MAEFLIKKVDATNPDSVKDQRGCYKRGDVVQVYEDGECRELPSPHSKMLIIKVHGMSKEEALKYTESEIRDDGLNEEGQPILTTMRRRKYCLNLDNMPAELEADREVVITSALAVSSLTIKDTEIQL